MNAGNQNATELFNEVIEIIKVNEKTTKAVLSDRGSKSGFISIEIIKSNEKTTKAVLSDRGSKSGFISIEIIKYNNRILKGQQIYLIKYLKIYFQ